MSIGQVFFIGAGSGDPGLITLRGIERLKEADVVLYDYLVNSDILAHASEEAELICLGKHGAGKIVSQPEINDLIVQYAKQGKTVLRLKGGDPCVFARISEELLAVESNGIPYEIVPGVTAAQAAASYAAVPFTDRNWASSVAFVTGHENPDKEESALDYASLANFPGTLVFYMGVTTASQWSQKLLDHGKDPQTPILIVRRTSWPNQRLYRCTLETVAEVLDQSKPDRIRPPALVFVGEVTQLAKDTSWFSERPLFGKKILITRSMRQSASLKRKLENLGADVLVQPAIDIQPAKDFGPLDQAIEDLKQIDWIVFSSANGVRYFFERLVKNGKDLRAIGHCKIGSIGPATADEIKKWHIHADVIPEVYRAENLVEALVPFAQDKHFLLVRASRGREVLSEGLTQAGAKVTQAVAYESTDLTDADEKIVQLLEAGKIEYTTVTSSAIAKSTINLLGDHLKKTKLVSISPITSAAISSLNLEAALEAETYDMDGVVNAILSDIK